MRRNGCRNGKMRYLAAVLGLVLSFSACGSSSLSGKTSAGAQAANAYADGEMAQEYYSDAVAEEGVSYDTAAAADAGGGAEKVTENASSNRKLIKTVNLNVETQEFDGLVGMVEQKVTELGGYIQNMENYNGSSYGNGRGSRYANLTLRIPRENLSGFVNNVTENANVTRRTESVEDITLSYVDLESHKEALQTEYDRLMALLDKAEYLEDIITLEQRLSNVRYQIESMESQLRTYDNKVDYSTVYLYITEVEVLTPVKQETVWERISGGFMQSLKNVGNGLVNFFVWLIVRLPYLLVWAAVIAAIVLIIKGMIKHSRKKKEKKAQQLAEEHARWQQQQQLREQNQPGQETKQ
ncbi:MAG: DUF4349 domain-containing protein [Roseburia sp.]|nr:DUF4349 domain-containing protein [Roseburia sp.]